MSVKYPHVLSPLVVRGHVLKNRLEVSNSLPHFLQGPESYPADSVITHYANKAKAGAAIVTCMGINNFSRGMRVPMEADFTHFPDFDLYDPASQNYLMQMADAIHYHGSIACMGFFVGPPSGYPLQKADGSLEILRIRDIAESKPHHRGPGPPQPGRHVHQGHHARGHQLHAGADGVYRRQLRPAGEHPQVPGLRHGLHPSVLPRPAAHPVPLAPDQQAHRRIQRQPGKPGQVPPAVPGAHPQGGPAAT